MLLSLVQNFMILGTYRGRVFVGLVSQGCVQKKVDCIKSIIQSTFFRYASRQFAKQAERTH